MPTDCSSANVMQVEVGVRHSRPMRSADHDPLSIVPRLLGGVGDSSDLVQAHDRFRFT